VLQKQSLPGSPKLSPVGITLELSGGEAVRLERLVRVWEQSVRLAERATKKLAKHVCNPLSNNATLSHEKKFVDKDVGWAAVDLGSLVNFVASLTARFESRPTRIPTTERNAPAIFVLFEVSLFNLLNRY
jgi:hypothetical protein